MADGGKFLDVPQHVAIIMDGNGRWARRRGMPRLFGHRAGAETVRHIVREAADIGIKYLTLFSFSTENWTRPRDEVDGLMSILSEYLDREVPSLLENGVRLRFIGDLGGLPKKLALGVQRAVEATAGCDRITVVMALNYGGRQEILEAARRLARRSAAGELDPDGITEEVFGKALSSGDYPAPDLLIRPSGEMRISNFLLWGLAYSELWFTDTLWPDFTPALLRQAVDDYRRRDRRYGGPGA